ncbi:hypothetical protein D3C76_1619870 [compost metagenome]
MAIHQIFVSLEEFHPLLFAVGEFLGFFVHRWNVVFLNHVRIQQRQGVLMFQNHWIILFTQFALECFTGCL